VHTSVTCVTRFHTRFRRQRFELKMTVRLSRHNTVELMLDPHSDGTISGYEKSDSDMSDTDL